MDDGWPRDAVCRGFFSNNHSCKVPEVMSTSDCNGTDQKAVAAALNLSTSASTVDQMTAERLIATCKLPHRMTKNEIFTCIKIYAGIRAYDAIKHTLLQNQTYNKAELTTMVDAIKRQHNATIAGNVSHPLYHAGK